MKVESTKADEVIDLTQDQQDTGDAYEDELDILEAKLDAADTKSLKKRAQLEMEIDEEKRGLKMKYLYKYALQEGDPLKIWS